MHGKKSYLWLEAVRPVSTRLRGTRTVCGAGSTYRSCIRCPYSSAFTRPGGRRHQEEVPAWEKFHKICNGDRSKCGQPSDRNTRSSAEVALISFENSMRDQHGVPSRAEGQPAEIRSIARRHIIGETYVRRTAATLYRHSQGDTQGHATGSPGKFRASRQES